MDKIFVNEMSFYGYHGVFPEEKKLGQRFLVDVCVEANLQQAGKSDDLHDSIHYGEIYEICKRIVEGKSYNLIEAVGEEIANTIIDRYPLAFSCTVKVTKTDPPIKGHYKSVAVELTRSRQK